MIDRVKRFTQEQGKSLLKFLIVGGLSFLIFAAAYFVFTRFLFPDANKTLMNALSICLSGFFNYFAHRGWTYRAGNGRHGEQFWRYLAVVISAALLQSFLFWLTVEQFGLYDGFVLIPIAGVCALYTYFAHGLFSFRAAKV